MVELKISTVNLGLRKGTHMTTGYKIMTSLAFSAALLTTVATMPAARAQMSTSGTVVVTNGPQSRVLASKGLFDAEPLLSALLLSRGHP
jgi:hypothetical protein